MQIRGFQKTSFVDYPGEICSTIFVGGCNLRCPYCFNRDLVLQPGALPSYREEDIFAFLEKRLPLQGALCITGGEPARQEDLSGFLAIAKKRGLKIKLDTNGTFPERLEQLLEEGNLDYVAVDFKAPRQKYDLLTGSSGVEAIDIYAKVKKTVSLLRDTTKKSSANSSASGYPAPGYELRTTVVPTLLDENDLIVIARELEGVSRLVLQQFQPLPAPRPTLIDANLQEAKPYPKEQIEEIAAQCRRYVEKVILRGF